MSPPMLPPMTTVATEKTNRVSQTQEEEWREALTCGGTTSVARDVCCCPGTHDGPVAETTAGDQKRGSVPVSKEQKRDAARSALFVSPSSQLVVDVPDGRNVAGKEHDVAYHHKGRSQGQVEAASISLPAEVCDEEDGASTGDVRRDGEQLLKRGVRFSWESTVYEYGPAG